MNDVKEIEKSIIKKFRSKIYKKFVHAVKDFELIKENDKICCCISGGKDSFLLAKCMQELQIHSKYHFDLKFIVMDPGYKKENLDKINANLKKYDFSLTPKSYFLLREYLLKSCF